ncbi:MAG: hypothetical protein NZ519_04175 [Bacteroidia bacterium]|nr:hypothetical protein [Bacteroidia bacterium]MDW8302975.1 hypothetical protein [Bacteroidia bacterium]
MNYRAVIFVAVSITAYLTQIVCKRGRMWTKLSHIQEETFALFNSLIEKLADGLERKSIIFFVPICLFFWYATEYINFYSNEVELIKIGQFRAAP